MTSLQTSVNSIKSFHSYKILLFAFVISLLAFSVSCKNKKSDPSKISVRPRVFIEGAAPVPILDEYDFTGVQLGTFADVFSENENGRIFALWLTTDRRAAITLQKETSRNLGRRLSLVVNGQAIAFHPVEKTITNGYIPFLFVNKIPEEQVMIIYNKFRESLVHLKAELEDLRN
jgi:hypothetical protein